MNKSPWISMWTSPRETIREILATNPKKGRFVLALIFGLQYVLGTYSNITQLFEISSLVPFFILLILSPIVGYIWFYLYAFFLSLIGKLFKGKAPFSSVIASTAWANLPYVINLALAFLILLLFVLHLITNIVLLPSGMSSFFALLSYTAPIWSFILLVNCMMEVQGFSVWKAVGNVLLAGLALGFIIGVSVFAISYYFISIS